jgi:MFS family permease
MSLQPTMGKLYSFLPVKSLFIAAMITFEAGSVLCASAPSSNIFIMGRVISGVGAAGIYAGGMIIIMTAVPLKRISVYLATLSSMWALAALIGPPLGGAFTDSHKLTWRFCFWINLRKVVDIWGLTIR